jgi:hypothetical protein
LVLFFFFFVTILLFNIFIFLLELTFSLKFLSSNLFSIFLIIFIKVILLLFSLNIFSLLKLSKRISLKSVDISIEFLPIVTVESLSLPKSNLKWIIWSFSIYSIPKIFFYLFISVLKKSNILYIVIAKYSWEYVCKFLTKLSLKVLKGILLVIIMFKLIILSLPFDSVYISKS